MSEGTPTLQGRIAMLEHWLSAVDRALKGEQSDFDESEPLVRAVVDLRGERDGLRAQLAEAQGCPHGGECGCSLMTRHEWWDAHSQERLKREAAEARAAHLEQERDEERQAHEQIAQACFAAGAATADGTSLGAVKSLVILKSQAEATVATLRDALAQVEWVYAGGDGIGTPIASECPWCHAFAYRSVEKGQHRENCPRQLALRAAGPASREGGAD